MNSEPQANPFAPPIVAAKGAPVPAASPAPLSGVWREGNLLVMSRDGRLPALCVKTGHPTEVALLRKYSWVHPAWYLILLVGLLPAIIVLLIMTKKASIYVPVTQEVKNQRFKKLMIAWGLGLGSIVMLFVGIALATDGNGFGALLILLFFIMLFGAAIFGSRAAQIIFPKRFTDRFLWFKGVHPNVLDRLEIWTYGDGNAVRPAPSKPLPPQNPNLPPQRL